MTMKSNSLFDPIFFPSRDYEVLKTFKGLMCLRCIIVRDYDHGIIYY